MVWLIWLVCWLQASALTQSMARMVQHKVGYCNEIHSGNSFTRCYDKNYHKVNIGEIQNRNKTYWIMNWMTNNNLCCISVTWMGICFMLVWELRSRLLHAFITGAIQNYWNAIFVNPILDLKLLIPLVFQQYSPNNDRYPKSSITIHQMPVSEYQIVSHGVTCCLIHNFLDQWLPITYLPL